MGSGKLSSKIIACPEPNLRGQAGTHAETREKGLTDRRGPAAPFLCAGHSRFSVPPQSQRAVLREPDIPERDCPPKVIMSSLAKVKMSYSQLQCPTVIGGHDGRRGHDHGTSKRIKAVARH